MPEPTTESYVQRWFISFEELVDGSGGQRDEIASLIDAGASPGPIYVKTGGEWWHALEEKPAPEGGERWYAPASAYWLRRARLAMRDGASFSEAARLNRDHFVGQFVSALSKEPLAATSLVETMVDGKVDPMASRERALGEWSDWITGGYAVCLRSFTGQTCVEKEALAYHLRRTEPDGRNDPELLDLIERLSALMLPFAPFQRPHCTPGLAVDRLLTLMELGGEDPYRRLA